MSETITRPTQYHEGMTADLSQRIIKELEVAADLHALVLRWYQTGKLSNGTQDVMDAHIKHASACTTLIWQLKKDVLQIAAPDRTKSVNSVGIRQRCQRAAE